MTCRKSKEESIIERENRNEKKKRRKERTREEKIDLKGRGNEALVLVGKEKGIKKSVELESEMTLAGNLESEDKGESAFEAKFIFNVHPIGGIERHGKFNASISFQQVSIISRAVSSPLQSTQLRSQATTTTNQLIYASENDFSNPALLSLLLLPPTPPHNLFYSKIN